MATRLAAAFRAQPNATITVDASSGGSTITELGGAATEYRIYNSGPSLAFIEIGTSTAIASANNSLPLAAGAIEFFRPPTANADPWLATISVGNSVLYVTPGEGV